ncbi:MAG: hypothetical protein D6E12_02535 [Desulfovibrio sp.]|nr:MAG: hypothetical protein D6E12_02535 [Desulfovibrio sp.]
MKLTGVHILLSYRCTFECEHCFLFCSPYAGGTFSFSSLLGLLDQAKQCGTVRTVVFEGGEPLMFYPLLLKGVETAHGMGFSVEAVTNGYWALNEQDAELWLKPLQGAGLGCLAVSDDAYHHGDVQPSPGAVAAAAARNMGMQAYTISIDPPELVSAPAAPGEKGKPVVGGDVRFRGRAVEKLAPGLPGRPWEEFTECPSEDFESPSRVHIDAAGNVQLCQGITIGNVWRAPLKEIAAKYDPVSHPVCGPLLEGGPARLGQELGLAGENEYVDACHLCYLARKQARQGLPETLVPAQAYGEVDEGPGAK